MCVFVVVWGRVGRGRECVCVRAMWVSVGEREREIGNSASHWAYNLFTFSLWLVSIIIMEIYAAPKLSKYMTALGAYNVKSFTYEINKHMHEYTNTHTRARAHTRTHTLTHACTHKHVVRNSY